MQMMRAAEDHVQKDVIETFQVERSFVLHYL